MMTDELASPPPFSFNDLLRKGGFDLTKIRFIRHQESGVRKGRTLYELWRDNRDEFDRYQTLHRIQAHRSLVKATHWAAFVHSPEGTMFVGFYRARYRGPSTVDYVSPTTGEVFPAGTLHDYDIEHDDFLRDYEGRIFIKWGDWSRSNQTYFQLATGKEKPIIEIKREYRDPEFPGYTDFIEPLSNIPTLPPTWIALLKSVKGVYALTCPRTKELYIGSAYGAGGFFARWIEYATTGHGGNLKLKSREPSNYQVSIIEVAGSQLSEAEIIALEGRWKDKLQTRDMGLNSN